MPLANDIAEVVMSADYLGQEVNNVFHLQAQDDFLDIALLLGWFEFQLIPDLVAVQNDEVLYTELRYRNLFNDGETVQVAVSEPGLVASGALELPSFVALSTRFDVGFANVKPGLKRWVGWTETNITDGLWSSTTLNAMDLITPRLLFGAATGPANWEFVVVKRICETANPDPDGVPSCLKYRLPENAGEATVGYYISDVNNPQPTTQNSRKYYTS